MLIVNKHHLSTPRLISIMDKFYIIMPVKLSYIGEFNRHDLYALTKHSVTMLAGKDPCFFLLSLGKLRTFGCIFDLLLFPAFINFDSCNGIRYTRMVNSGTNNPSL